MKTEAAAHSARAGAQATEWRQGGGRRSEARGVRATASLPTRPNVLWDTFFFNPHADFSSTSRHNKTVVQRSWPTLPPAQRPAWPAPLQQRRKKKGLVRTARHLSLSLSSVSAAPWGPFSPARLCPPYRPATTATTGSRCPRSVETHSAVASSHTRTLPSLDPERITLHGSTLRVRAGGGREWTEHDRPAPAGRGRARPGGRTRVCA